MKKLVKESIQSNVNESEMTRYNVDVDTVKEIKEYLDEAVSALRSAGSWSNFEKNEEINELKDKTYLIYKELSNYLHARY